MQRGQIIVVFTFLFISVALFVLRDSPIVNSVVSIPQNFLLDVRAMIFSNTVSEESLLEKENIRLKEKLAEFEILQRENIALKSQFEENVSSSFKLLPARITGFKGRGAYESFIIDAGINQGIKEGMAVIVGNVLVGTIHKVSQNISDVRTILHSEFSTIVKYPPTNARGIIRGYNSFLLMENIVITDNLDLDGIVVTMGELNDLGVGVPSDLSVGKIDSIEKVETASFQTAQIEPLLDYSQISKVFVIVEM